MIILPAIDLKDGACVRLVRGEFGTAGKVAEDAVQTALSFTRAGAKWMHMVDLDGARTGDRPNRELILAVARSADICIELGGGIRDMASVEDYLSHGIARVILGSAAMRDPDFLRRAVSRYGARIAVGIDSRRGYVSTEGWLNTSRVSYLEFAKRMESVGVRQIIFTDIDCDGTLGGPNVEQLAALQAAVSCRVVASGGIRDIDHIAKLKKMGLFGAICGKSIYSGTLDLKRAIEIGGDQDAGETNHSLPGC